MAKKFQLTIAEPCHENWDGMTPVEKGKFCGSCQKQVVDFSDMSDRQVAEFFKKPSTGSVCGRFMTDQLDRPIEIPKKRIPWVKYFFQIALPAFLVSVKASASKTQGEIKVNKVSSKDTTRRPVYNDYKMMGMVARPENLKPFMGDTIVTPVQKPIQTSKGEIAIKDTVTVPLCIKPKMGAIAIIIPDIEKNEKDQVRGRVVNEQGEPVSFASIETGKPGFIIVADEDGRFIIKKGSFLKENKIIISSVGFESKEVSVTKTTGDLLVQLKSNAILPEVVIMAMGITTKGKAAMGYSTIKGQTVVAVKKDTTINTEKTVPADENNLLIYPNPVQSGSTLNLSFKKFEEGYYQLQILNQSGQMVEQKEIWIDAEARLLSLEIPSVAAGNYFMVLINKKSGKKFTEKIIIR